MSILWERFEADKKAELESREKVKAAFREMGAAIRMEKERRIMDILCGVNQSMKQAEIGASVACVSHWAKGLSNDQSS